jgi:hypothetical protein
MNQKETKKRGAPFLSHRHTQMKKKSGFHPPYEEWTKIMRYHG